MRRVSVLDLAPIRSGETAGDAFRQALDLARHAETLGFHRLWLAEHHNMPGIASAATPVVIGYVAGGTKTLRVGSGGIMLPNHAPLVVAEQFGTLAAMYPGRIELGLGRAPGTDERTARALRRDRMADTFPQDVVELQAWLRPAVPGQAVQAVPGAGADVPIWLLGSSLFSAQLAGRLGLPYAFASHFAPDYLAQAIEVYRREFRPGVLAAPYAMAGVNVFAADTAEEAARLPTSMQLQFVNLARGTPGPLGPAVDTMEGRWSPPEQHFVTRALRESVVGTRDVVRRWLREFRARTGVDEVIVSSHIHDPVARHRSLTLTAEAAELAAA